MQCRISNNKSILVDAPGYKDTRGRDDMHFNNLESYLYGCGGVDAFLLVISGSNPRFDGAKKEMLQDYPNFGIIWLLF